MGRYRLKAGQHIQADYTQEPTVIPYTDKFGKAQQQVKYPSKTYNVGDVVENDEDLVLRHGADKFEYVQPRAVRGKPNVKGPLSGPATHPTLPPQSPGSRREGPGEETQRQFREQMGIGTDRPPEDPRVVDGRSLDEPVHPNEDNPGGEGGNASELQTTQEAELDEMTVNELRSYAADNEIDLSGAKNKSEVLYMIKEARKEQGQGK